MDAADREPGGHGHGHRVEMSLLPLKKRALNYYSNAGDPYASPSSKKKRVVDDDSVVGAETKDTIGAFEAPVPRQRRSVPAAASHEPAAALPAPAAASPAAEPAVAEGNAASSDEEKRLSKGKWLSVPAAASHEPAAALPAPAAASPAAEPSVAEGNAASSDEEKRLSKGKWLSVPAAASHEPAAALPAPAAASPATEPAAAVAEGNAASSDEEKQLSNGKWLAREESSSSLPQPAVKKLMHDGICSFVPQPQQHAWSDLGLGEALERRLAELGATRPWLVHKKTLHKSDVDENQNRLLVSCKRVGSGTKDCPITRCFSPDEKARVDNKEAGLWVTAFDRGGAAYALTWKFLGSNNGYRFITEWKDFLTRNGMNLNSQRNRLWTRDVEVELWAFRSRKLPFQPQLDAEVNGKPVTVTTLDENGKKVTVVQRVSHHLDPDGALGLLLLHRENRRRVVKEEEEDVDDGDWKGPSSPPAVARKKGKQHSGKRRASASASPVALPAPVAEQRGATQSEPTYYAAVGLAKLRQSIWERWQQHVDRGHGGNKKGLSNDVAKSSADVEGEKIKTNNKKASLGAHSIKVKG